ncbi:hypothetical protein BST61_g6319 [Cercospora zeina]
MPTTPPMLPPAIAPTFELSPLSGDVEAVEDAEEITKSVCQFCPCEGMVSDLTVENRKLGVTVAVHAVAGTVSAAPSVIASVRPSPSNCNRHESNSIGRRSCTVPSLDPGQCQDTLCCTAIPTLHQYKPLESSPPVDGSQGTAPGATDTPSA